MKLLGLQGCDKKERSWPPKTGKKRNTEAAEIGAPFEAQGKQRSQSSTHQWVVDRWVMERESRYPPPPFSHKCSF